MSLVGAGAAAYLINITPVEEGVILYGYKDPLGIPTKCMGDTRNVIVGKKYTREECAESMAQALIDHANPVIACSPEILDAPPKVIAAVISFNYNTGAFCNRKKTQLAALTREKSWPEVCDALMYDKYGRPYFVTGKNRLGQRVFLKGLWKRREVEMALCYSGLDIPLPITLKKQSEADLAIITKAAERDLAKLIGSDD